MKHRIYRCCKQVIGQCQRQLTLLFPLLVASLAAVPVYGQTEYQFSSTPKLISGAPLSLGSIYRFERVNGSADALVKIAWVRDASILQIDESMKGPAVAFQPVIVGHTSDAFVDFEITFVANGGGSGIPFSTVVSALDLDDPAEFVQFFPVSHLSVESDSNLTLDVTAPQTLQATVDKFELSPASALSTRSAVTVGFRDVYSFIYRVGVRDKSQRKASLLFASMNFVDARHLDINGSPDANDDIVTVDLNRTLVTDSPGLLHNDVDIDDDQLSISSFRVDETTYSAGSTVELVQGHLTINTDGAYRFIPAPNFVGLVPALSYIAVDGEGGRDEAVVNLSIVDSIPRPRVRQVLADDTVVNSPVLTIDEDENDDGWISSLELQGQIDISFVLPESAAVGDRLNLSNGISEQNFLVSAETIQSRKITTSFPTPADGATIEILASYYDVAENPVSTSLDRASLDLLPNATPVVSIVADNDDSGFLSLQEYVEQSIVEITLPETVVVNDRVEVRVGSKVTDVVLTPVDIANGKLDVPVTMPVEGSTLSVLVRLFDEAGNISEVASDSVLIDTVAPVPPTVDPLSILTSTPVIVGSLPVDGDFILSVVVNGVVYASDDGDLLETGNGRWQLTIPELDALENGIYDIQAIVTDMAGNQSVDTTANELNVDLVVPQISVVNNGLDTDPAPRIHGSADQPNGSLVRVATAGNLFVCNAVVEQEQWSCRSRVMFPVGENHLIASISDSVGNSGSAVFPVTIVTSSDQDGDGIPDDVDGADDADGDGIANYMDLDSDNDTISDYLETAIDTDGDQIRDFLDLDSDNDTLSDLLEANFSTLVDKDNNGMVDGAIIVGDNGLADVVETVKDSGDSPQPRDSDNDGLFDYIDSDSDNDSIADVVEQGINGSDELNEFAMQDNLSQKYLFAAVDTDVDGIPDYRDLDSDQDGVPDLLEATGNVNTVGARLGSIIDDNKDGMSDQKLESGQLDVDRDGVLNQKDLDSDADGISDLIESGGVDVNLDGVHDGWVDQNQNGISDNVDWTYTNGTDADGDAIDDSYDIDFAEGQDSDSDGVLDAFDIDSDGDGRLDLLNDIELSIADANGDGVADMFEPDLLAVIATGTGSFGCSLSTTSGTKSSSSRIASIDPTLVLLLFTSVAACTRGRRKLFRSTYG